MPAELASLAIIASAFLAGGMIKGILGIGLPLVTVPVIATFTDPLYAISLMFVPAVTSNILQARQAGLSKAIVRKYWIVCAGVIIGTTMGTEVLTESDTATAQLFLSVVVVLFCISQLMSTLPTMSERWRKYVTPVLGSVSGFAGGISGFFGLVLVPFLLSLRLDKETFVATIALLYLSGVSALYLSLGLKGELHLDLVAASALSALPTLLGVTLGARLRRRIEEQLFRRVLIIALLVIALNLLRQAIWA